MTNIDMFSQVDLYKLLQQVTDNAFKRHEVCDLQLINASLQMNTLISPVFFEDNIGTYKRPNKYMKGARKILSYFQQATPTPGEEPELHVIKNAVQVCVTKTHLILLKEKWQNWCYCRNIKKHFEEIQIANDLDNQSEQSTQTTQGLPQNEQVKNMLSTCIKKEAFLFNVITTVEIGHIHHLNIHYGQQPSVEINISFQDQAEQQKQKKPKKGSKNQEKEEEYEIIQLLLPGDMERQKLIEMICDRKNSMGEEQDDDHDQIEQVGDNEDEDESDVDNDSQKDGEFYVKDPRKQIFAS